MDILLAYACLLAEGFALEEAYEKRLNALFLAAPEDADLLELELLSGSISKSIVYIRTHIDYNALNQEKFGRELMHLLQPVYESMELEAFGSWMFALWEGLPGHLQDAEPFFTLCLADDPPAWKNTVAVRAKYEAMLHFYDAVSKEA